MGADDSIWAVLGVAPTKDERAIRMAYARRLKAIDVDSNAAGFIALRSAYEAALARARGTHVESWLDTAPPEPSAGPAREQTEDREDERDPLRTAIQALHLLFDGAAKAGGSWLTVEEKLELCRCWAEIAAATDAGDIARYGAAEKAVRWMILSWGRLAVGLVPFAVEHFRWAAHEGELSEDGATEIMWRYRGIQFLQRVRRPGHSHFPAWAELTSKYYPGSRRGRCDPLLVHELLAMVRHVWPEVETEFDPGRVELWRNNTADPAHPENPNTQYVPRAAKVATAIVVGIYALQLLFGLIGLLVGKTG